MTMADHFIPIRCAELVEMLCAAPDLPAEDGEQFRQLCRRIVAGRAFEYHGILEKLKAAYAPFDPDCDTRSLLRLRSEERQHKLIDLLADFGSLMERANYKHMSSADIEAVLGARSDWGLLVDIDFHIFERLVMFVRGDTVERRPLRRMRRLFRRQEVDVPVYQRLVMIMKLRKHPRLSKHIDTEKVYLQIFKNIPKLDINMLLPGARVRMTKIDRSKIGLPMLSGLGMALYNIAGDFANAIMHIVGQPSMFIVWGLATGAVSYGTKSYFSYLTTRQRYNLNLTQVLYFQNLDTNAGVLFRILDEAHEQECRELLLTYFCIWRHAGEPGLTGAALLEIIQRLLADQVELKVSVDIADALAKLEKQGLIERVEDRYRALPIRAAIGALDSSWSTCLNHASQHEATHCSPHAPREGASRGA
jgi:hypothetical protein